MIPCSGDESWGYPQRWYFTKMECALCEIARIRLAHPGAWTGLGKAPVRTTSIKRDLAGSSNPLAEMTWTVSSTGYSMRRRWHLGFREGVGSSGVAVARLADAAGVDDQLVADLQNVGQVGMADADDVGIDVLQAAAQKSASARAYSSSGSRRGGMNQKERPLSRVT